MDSCTLAHSFAFTLKSFLKKTHPIVHHAYHVLTLAWLFIASSLRTPSPISYYSSFLENLFLRIPPHEWAEPAGQALSLIPSRESYPILLYILYDLTYRVGQYAMLFAHIHQREYVVGRYYDLQNPIPVLCENLQISSIGQVPVLCEVQCKSYLALFHAIRVGI